MERLTRGLERVLDVVACELASCEARNGLELVSQGKYLKRATSSSPFAASLVYLLFIHADSTYFLHICTQDQRIQSEDGLSKSPSLQGQDC